MPGTSAKTVEVKLRVPVEIASAIETYAQAHTHGNKTKAYLHFIEEGMSSQGESAPVTKADLMAVAAAQQASMQKLIASQQLPALPSAEDISAAVEQSIERSVDQRLTDSSEYIASSVARHMKQNDSSNRDTINAAYQRGYLAGKQAEDRRAMSVALNMGALMRTVCGTPFIRAFLMGTDADFLNQDLTAEALIASIPDNTGVQDVADATPEPSQPRSVGELPTIEDDKSE